MPWGLLSGEKGVNMVDDEVQDEKNDENGPDEEGEQTKEGLDVFAGLRRRIGDDGDEEEQSSSRVGLGGRVAGCRGLGLEAEYRDDEKDNYNAEEEE